MKQLRNTGNDFYLIICRNEIEKTFKKDGVEYIKVQYSIALSR
jgi:hypothetical protein